MTMHGYVDIGQRIFWLHILLL